MLLDGSAASPGNTARWVVHDAVPDQHRYPATTASGARFEDRASSPIGARDSESFRAATALGNRPGGVSCCRRRGRPDVVTRTRRRATGGRRPVFRGCRVPARV
ncbi:hypothetical protein C5E45_22620 [Nocardia nova]|uniref:Uncharacterized protein n=1 Tax=Nocardia nova TaxID=37330 RepID=A0A2S6AL07_9NOCA|nr:hypothetical protein C5E45_22620 [Nocardia nova]